MKLATLASSAAVLLSAFAGTASASVSSTLSGAYVCHVYMYVTCDLVRIKDKVMLFLSLSLSLSQTLSLHTYHNHVHLLHHRVVVNSSPRTLLTMKTTSTTSLKMRTMRNMRTTSSTMKRILMKLTSLMKIPPWNFIRLR